MAVKGVKHIFEQSEEKCKLFYIEYFGKVDSKDLAKGENTYTDKQVTIIKVEWVRHLQKHVGTALHKFKKERESRRQEKADRCNDRLQNYYGISIRSHFGPCPK